MNRLHHEPGVTGVGVGRQGQGLLQEARSWAGRRWCSPKPHLPSLSPTQPGLERRAFQVRMPLGPPAQGTTPAEGLGWVLDHHWSV